MMNVGIDLPDIVKVPRTQVIYKIAHSTIEGIGVPVGNFLLKPS